MPKKGEVRNDFLVIGSSTVDVLAKTSNVERIDIRGKTVERLVCISFASKSELESLELQPGGSASNSAIMIRTLGSSVYLLSAVGNDDFGRAVLRDLEKNGINPSTVRIFPDCSTGVGLSIISSGGEKSILIYRGANSELGSRDVPEAAVRNSKRIFVASLVSARNYELFRKVLALSKKHGRPVVFAPSITMLHSWMPELRKLKPDFDMVIMNYEEASYYTGKSGVREILDSLPGKVSVITNDLEGAYASERRGRTKRCFHVSAVPVKVVDTTGAGDAFSGAFAHMYYSTGSIGAALKTAAASAALKLIHKGAHFSLKKAALDRFMREKSSKLVVKGF